MALLKWGEDEEKKDDQFESPVIKTVQSVQSGWQPTQAMGEDGAEEESGNYLLSEQKAQIDHQQQQQRAAEDAARAQAAAEAADAANRAAAAQEAQIVEQPQTIERSVPKYAGGGQKKNEGGVTGFLKNVGAGIQQGLAAVGDVAIQGGGVIGAIGKNDQQLVKHMAEVEKVRGWLHGGRDINGNKFVGTRDVEENASRIAAGRGTVQDYVAVGGKGLQAGIDATMFMNPVRLAAGAVKTMPVVNSATLATRVANNPAVRFAARDAAFYGGLQGAATTATQYGETGELDEALKAGMTDAAVGGLVQGGLDMGGHVVRKAYEPFLPGANKTVNSLRTDELTPAPELPTELPPEQPQRFADGIAQPSQDGNLAFEAKQDDSETPIEIPAFNEILPIADSYTPATPNTPPVAGNLAPAPVQPAPIEMPEQPTPEAPMPLNELEQRATMDNFTPVKDAPIAPAAATPVADGAVMPNVPVVKSEEVRALQESRAGASQAEEAAINQQLQSMDAPRIDDADTQLQELDAALERGDISYDEHARMEDELFARENAAGRAMAEDSNVPDMDAPLGDVKPLGRKAVAQRLMPKLADNSDMKTRLANAVDLGKDTDSQLEDILRDGNVEPARAERITKLFNQLDAQLKAYNAPQAVNQKAYTKGGADAIDPEAGKARSRVTRDMGITQRRLVREIDKLQGSRDFKVALVNNMADLIGTRNANILTSAGLLERNVTQELTAGLKLAVKNPVKMAKSAFNNGNIIGDTIKSELSHWKEAPTNPVEGLKYVIGNTYRTAMIPTTMLANTRRGMYRDELTKWAYETLEGRSVSSAEAHKLAGTAGNEMEALVNTLTGVDNGMTNRFDAEAALKSWKEYIKSGSDADKNAFLQKVEQHTNLADQMIAGLSKDDAVKGRALKALGNLIFPFVRTATNLMKTTVKQDLNPAAKSLVDEIRSDLRSPGANVALTLKSKLVDYGIMSGAAALVGAGVIAYNNGDEVDKPRGWSIDIGDGNFVPIRATAFELPIALAGTAQQIAQDIQAGKPREVSYYAGMVTGSLPYIDTFNQTTGAVDSLMNGEDAGYAAKAYGINMAKSFVPGSNNGVEAYVDGKNGESTNAKTVYATKEVPDGEGGTKKVADMPKWFEQSIQSSGLLTPFGKTRDQLVDSRDAAGRTRTVDNQGAITNKTINDKNSALHNDTIDDLVNYGRESKLGKGTADMFNSYPDGKDNNFKSIQDAITFLDVEEVNGKKTPSAEKKLENNAKLGVLAAQIRDGFYGDTGNDLLTLDGQELKSDASVPNKSGTKNSKLPMSMQSIKNAVAATDLPQEQQDRMYEISQANQALYERRKNKEITYDQEQEMKAANEQEYVQILSGSKNYKRMVSLMDKLRDTGFFNEGGLGSTKSGQTYLWNSLNALLGAKGATPAANYPDTGKGFTPWGRGGGGSGSKNTNKNGNTGTDGVKWTPAGKRQMAKVSSGKYTPVSIKVKLGNEVKKNRTQNYADRSF